MSRAGPFNHLSGVACVAVLATLAACSDNPTAVGTRSRIDVPNEVAAATVMQAHAALRVGDDVYAYPTIKAPARYVEKSSLGHWEVAQPFSPVAPGPDGTLRATRLAQSDEGSGLLADAAANTGHRASHQRFTSDTRDGHTYTVAEVSDTEAVFAGRPPRITIVLEHDKPVFALRNEYKHAKGVWTAVASTVYAFDSTGRQIASVRFDLTGPKLASTNSRARMMGGVLDELAVRLRGVEQSTLALFSPAPLYAAGAACASGPSCRGLWWAAVGASALATAAWAAFSAASAACLAGQIELCPELTALYEAAVGASAAATAAWAAYAACKAAGGKGNLIPTDAPSINFQRSLSKGLVPRKDIDVDLGRVGAHGRYVKQVVHLNAPSHG